MKIALMTGSKKNAGDFLIVQRSRELLKQVYPHCELVEYERWKVLTNELEEINKCDVMIFAGGPLYMPNAYPHEMPLISNLEELKPKMFALGLGWYGNNTSNEIIYNYKFCESTSKLFERIIRDSGKLGCRDWYSVLALKHNQLHNSIMTGCPAWYNLDFIGRDIRLSKEYNKICISDPTRRANYLHCIPFIKHIRDKFPQAELQFVFHRGISADSYTTESQEKFLITLKNSLEELGIEWIDISFSSKGFSVYDNCDLHIGYRVHAHIYNLSRRNKSILIEEDGRGAGVNGALGLPSLIAHKVYGENPEPNEHMLDNFDDHFFMLESNEFIQLKLAYANMEKYFEIMQLHLKTIQNLI